MDIHGRSPLSFKDFQKVPTMSEFISFHLHRRGVGGPEPNPFIRPPRIHLTNCTNSKHHSQTPGASSLDGREQGQKIKGLQKNAEENGRSKSSQNVYVRKSLYYSLCTVL